MCLYIPILDVLKYELSMILGTLHNLTESIGVMDLGGGSTQVTFVPKDQVFIV